MKLKDKLFGFSTENLYLAELMFYNYEPQNQELF